MFVKTKSSFAFCYCVVALAFLCDGFFSFLGTPAAAAAMADESANVLPRLAIIPSCLFSGWFFIKYKSGVYPFFSKNKVFWLVVIFCGCSFLWSSDVFVTVSRFALLLACTFFGLSIGGYFSRSDLMVMIVATCVLLSIINFVSAVLVPNLAIHQDMHYPAIRGMFPHKNLAGRTLLTGFVAALALTKLSGFTLKAWISAATIILAVCLTLSSASLFLGVVIFMVFILFGFLARVKSGQKFNSFVIVFMVLAAFFLSGAFEYLYEYALSLAGKDETLTGRVFIWAFVFDNLKGFSVLWGFGYEAFWRSSTGVFSLWPSSYFVPGHAHNGYVHVISNIGLIGLIGFFVAFVFVLNRGFRQLINVGDSYGLFVVMFLVFFALTNITEPSIMVFSNLPWVVFTAVMVQSSVIRSEA